MDSNFIIGIDLGGTNLKIALLDLRYKTRSKKILTTRKFSTKESLIGAIIGSVDNIIDGEGLRRSDILGIGLGLPGPVDEKSGIVHFFPNIPGWKEVRLKNILQNKLKLPVAVDNDAKLMCLAEHRLGAARGLKNVLCLTLGTGVGSGIIIDGRLYRGANNASGEMGHMPINEDGPACGCGGRACLESYIGNNNILREARSIFERGISLEELSSLAKKGNKRAINIWSKAGERLGIALSGIINLLNLDAIVIGGGVSNAGKVLFDPVKRTINSRAMAVQAKRAKVLKARLGGDAGLIGAAILVKEEFSP